MVTVLYHHLVYLGSSGLSVCVGACVRACVCVCVYERAGLCVIYTRVYAIKIVLACVRASVRVCACVCVCAGTSHQTVHCDYLILHHYDVIVCTCGTSSYVRRYVQRPSRFLLINLVHILLLIL